MVNPLIEQEISSQLEFIQHSLEVLELSEIKITPGASPLDVDNVAVVGNSVYRSIGDPSQGAGWSIVWGNGRRPISGSYPIGDNHSDPYFSFAVFIEALRVTPRNESLTVISEGRCLKDYIKYKKVIVQGKCVVGKKFKVIEPLLAQLDDLLKDRPGVVDVINLEANPSRFLQLKKSAQKIATRELRKLRKHILKNMRSSRHRSSGIKNRKKRYRERKNARARSRRSLPSRSDRHRPLSVRESSFMDSNDIHQPSFIPLEQDNGPSSSSTREVGESGTNSALRAMTPGLLRWNSRKRQANDVVPVEVDTCNNKQVTEPPASDTEGNDMYEDAAGSFDQVDEASTLARSPDSTLINAFRHLFYN
ncbi:hypothetical protein BJV82DRAFT_637540 [Fennellomyces sp. T-0311]|nr:hypothetical protein BJV82DRAFT_637540 [Fennellomyces sp. T-0311]